MREPAPTLDLHPRLAARRVIVAALRDVTYLPDYKITDALDAIEEGLTAADLRIIRVRKGDLPPLVIDDETPR